VAMDRAQYDNGWSDTAVSLESIAETPRHDGSTQEQWARRLLGTSMLHGCKSDYARGARDCLRAFLTTKQVRRTPPSEPTGG
jgi:hypothetical protein